MNGPILNPLTNLEVVQYGNMIGVDWDHLSLDAMRKKIEREGLTPAKVRDELRVKW